MTTLLGMTRIGLTGQFLVPLDQMAQQHRFNLALQLNYYEVAIPFVVKDSKTQKPGPIIRASSCTPS